MKQLYFLLCALLLAGLHGMPSINWLPRLLPARQGGNTINSNVPLNEISIHAYRDFQKMFPAVSGEYWLKTAEGYIVSFARIPSAIVSISTCVEIFSVRKNVMGKKTCFPIHGWK